MLALKLILGLIIVLWGAELLINSAVALGKKYKISELLIGILVIGFGTSLSELIVSIDAVLKNASELTLGNIIGSNIANILLVLGVAGLAKKIKIPNISNLDSFFHLSVTTLLLFIFFFYDLNYMTGIIFILLFIIYIFVIIKKMGDEKNDETQNSKDFISRKVFERPIIIGIPIIIFSISLTIYGADLTVNSAIKISLLFGISEAVIGLTLVAIGTSLPEMAAGITAARKMRTNLIFGNIIGSNLYNILLILGFSSLFKNFSYNKNNLSSEIIFLMFCTILFIALTKLKKVVNVNISIILLLFYLVYILYIYHKNFL